MLVYRKSGVSLIFKFMIELTSAIILLVTSLYGGPADIAIAQEVTNDTKSENPVTLENYVREYFRETPILAEVARCESTFRQMDQKTGEALRGKVNKSDIGLMQVNEYYHGEKASELGFDLETVNGNLDYAKYLYDKEGTTPWNASKKCWGNK
jgi:hypothetical protein